MATEYPAGWRYYPPLVEEETEMGKVTKIHKADSGMGKGYTMCSYYDLDPSMVRVKWRGVTCKNCLKMKK